MLSSVWKISAEIPGGWESMQRKYCTGNPVVHSVLGLRYWLLFETGYLAKLIFSLTWYSRSCALWHTWEQNCPKDSKDTCFCLKAGLVLKGLSSALCYSTLKCQICFCSLITRLSKLETFQKIVVEELASLEKETQILANMEKDAVVCVTSRVPACRGTPSQVMGVFFGVLLGLLECTVAQTEFFLQPAKAKVRLY